MNHFHFQKEFLLMYVYVFYILNLGTLNVLDCMNNIHLRYKRKEVHNGKFEIGYEHYCISHGEFCKIAKGYIVDNHQ